MTSSLRCSLETFGTSASHMYFFRSAISRARSFSRCVSYSRRVVSAAACFDMRLRSTDGNSFGTENFGLEVIEFFDFLQEFHGFREKVESVNDHNFALSILEVSKTVQKVGNYNITSNHSIGEDSISVVLTRDLKGKHGL